MSLGPVIPRGDYNPLSGGGKTHGFDFIRAQPFDVDNLVKVPSAFTVFQVPANMSGAEISRLCVTGEPRGLWFATVSWRPTVSGGGAQEILVSSNWPDRTNAGVAIPVPPGTANRSDAGLRYISYGSLMDPLPVSIRMAPSQKFGITILVAGNEFLIGTVPFMVYVRASGVFFRS